MGPADAWLARLNGELLSAGPQPTSFTALKLDTDPSSKPLPDSLLEPIPPRRARRKKTPMTYDGRKLDFTEEIYLLGLGNVGKFLAHSLAGLEDRPGVTIITHSGAAEWEYVKAGKTITLLGHGNDVSRTGFGFEFEPLSVLDPLFERKAAEKEAFQRDIAELSRIMDEVPDTEQERGKGENGQLVEEQRVKNAVGPIEGYDETVTKNDPLDDREGRPSSVRGESQTPLLPGISALADMFGQTTTDLAKQTAANLSKLEQKAEKKAAHKERTKGRQRVADMILNQENHLRPFFGRTTPIRNLIIAKKSGFLVRALKSISHRLDKDSTILFMQNGLGLIEKVDRDIFTDPNNKPTYLTAITTHGLYSESHMTVVHSGLGNISLGLSQVSAKAQGLSDSKAGDLQLPSARYLIETIKRTPALAAVDYGPTELFALQLEKLAVNCVINPLTVMLNCRNGELLYNFWATRLMRLLLSEISLVIRSLPELTEKNYPSHLRFAPDRLESIVVAVASRTATNISSMLQDSQAGSKTEIEYINGYIVGRGERLGIQCVMNYMLMSMVLAKTAIQGRERAGYVPVGRMRDQDKLDAQDDELEED
ncbi:MAG: hypothetical protein M1814_006275 [Vezdaea aestivalis]|nr:MAG: hypothetical protein M1814_006275 [Vezdaea aestivalis]